MQKRIIVVALVSRIVPAFADTVEDEVATPVTEATHGFHAGALAQLSSEARDDGSDSTASGAGEVRYRGELCDYIRVGGLARLAYTSEDGALAGGDQWTSACLPFVNFEISHRLEWEVRPSLLAARELRRGLNTRDTTSFYWHMLRIPRSVFAIEPSDPPKPGLVDLFGMGTNITMLWSPTAPAAARIEVSDTMVSYHRPQDAWGEAHEFTVDVVDASAEFLADGTRPMNADSAGNIGFWATHISDLAIGPVLWGGGIGFDEFYVDPHVTHLIPRAELTAKGMLDDWRFDGRIGHESSLTPDGFVTIDSRLSGSASHLFHTRTRLSLEGMIAKTKIESLGEPNANALTGGGALALLQPINRHLSAQARVDVAKSFYAPSATDTRPEWGATAFAGLAARVGK
ncbi:MAG: hypothetical protein QM831_18785 [Kofleriaceae bacterium]